MAPPFRSDHIGSLLRPRELLGARQDLGFPSLRYMDVPESVKKVERDAIRQVVQLQLFKGIRPITDGEYARDIFYDGFFENLAGFEVQPALPIPDAFRTDFPTTTGLVAMGVTTRAAVICTRRISYMRSPYLSEWLELRYHIPQNLWGAAKFTIPSPTYQHIQLKPGTAWTPESGYTSDQEYLYDLARCYVVELQGLHDHGLRNLQIDDPHLTYFASEVFRAGCAKDGVDADELLDLYIRTHNKVLEGKPDDLHVGVHLCRGNMSGSVSWVEGSYEVIARKLFCHMNYETYYLEFDDVERVGGFECLRFLPKGKNVVLGLISTKTTELEDPRVVKKAIYKAAEVIADAQGVSVSEALDCLAVSPQCGFSSNSLAGGKGVTESIMWNKLQLVKRVAEEVWGQEC